MINLIQENLDTSIAMLTLIVSVLVIFLGLSDDQKGASIILCKWFFPTVDCF
ncbi:hypothetical protein EsFM111_21070 [Enterococcus sp. FM11-1]|nr:hypothetical protein EsFM111_21070 [Enterococcus sp. FM11-1]